MTIFLLFFISFYYYVFWIFFENFSFRKQREKIQWRIHINGIRGKSTVARYAQQFLEKLAITLLVKLQVMLRELFDQMEKTILIAAPILFLLKKSSLSTISGK